MQAAQAWERLFTPKHLEEHYYEKIESSPSTGMDKITPIKFKEELQQNIDIIIRKARNETYSFTRYKQLLFIKGPTKPPRAVCIPTLRDKLTVSVLNELLNKVYGNDCITEMPQMIIDEITKDLTEYTHFIKLDLKTFYGSIDHDILFKKIKLKIRKPAIVSLINKAIKTSAISYPIKDKIVITQRNLGVPEGLAISNALANIYLMELDNKYTKKLDICYWRYVDDIFILTNKNNFEVTKEEISMDIFKLKLEFNEKIDEGLIDKGFEYLGYRINSSDVTVRNSSVLKIEQSIEDIFRQIQRKNFKYLEWKINLKITGFILDNHKYGWLFFYSQITDKRLLFRLDNLVNKFVDRYNLGGKIHIKRFVRTYFEIREALHVTKYIPNFDDFTIEQKKLLLREIYDLNFSEMNDEKIEFEFRKVMATEIRDIEKDIQDIS